MFSYAACFLSITGVSLTGPLVWNIPVLYPLSSVRDWPRCYSTWHGEQIMQPLIPSVQWRQPLYQVCMVTGQSPAFWIQPFNLGIGTFGSLIAWVDWYLRLYSISIIYSTHARVWTYIPTDAPNYHNGNSLNLATSCAASTLTFILFLFFRWENGKRDRGERDYRLEGKTSEEIEQLGYLHPGFRYQTWLRML